MLLLFKFLFKVDKYIFIKLIIKDILLYLVIINNLELINRFIFYINDNIIFILYILLYYKINIINFIKKLNKRFFELIFLYKSFLNIKINKFFKLF